MTVSGWGECWATLVKVDMYEFSVSARSGASAAFDFKLARHRIESMKLVKHSEKLFCQ